MAGVGHLESRDSFSVLISKKTTAPAAAMAQDVAWKQTYGVYVMLTHKEGATAITPEKAYERTQSYAILPARTPPPFRRIAIQRLGGMEIG